MIGMHCGPAQAAPTCEHGVGVRSTLGFFAWAKDPPESRANYTHPKRINGMMVDLPEDMRQLSWSIEDYLSYQ